MPGTRAPGIRDTARRLGARDTVRRRGMRSAAALGGLLGLMALAGCGGGGGPADDGTSHNRNAPATTGAAPTRADRGSGSPASGPGSGPAWDRSPDSITALGDSITTGFDACLMLSDCRGASWATGTGAGAHSLAQRLLDGPARNSWNYARVGARMADLPGQVAKAVVHRPQLVTVLLGTNDACRPGVGQMTPVADFRAEFETSLKQLHRALPKAQVYVASIPDLRRLWSEGRRSPRAKKVWNLGICASMLRAPDAMDPAAVARRQQVYDRVVAYNTALKEVCAAQPLCRYDGGAVFGYRFTAAQLSKWDWFHPSRDGQQRLAEIAYRRITAAAPAT